MKNVPFFHTIQILMAAVIISFIILPSGNAEYLSETEKNQMSEHFNRATQLHNEGKKGDVIKGWQQVAKFDTASQLFEDRIEKDIAKENIAVLDLKAINTSAADAVAISEFIGIALVKTDKFNVVERSDIDKILAEQGFQQTGCTTDECAVQIGQILNVHKAIVGTFSMIGNSYYVTAKIIDVETGKIISSEKVQCLNLDYITSSIDKLVSLITGEEIIKSVRKAEEKKRRTPLENGEWKIDDEDLVRVDIGGGNYLMWARDKSSDGCNNGRRLSWFFAVSWARNLVYKGYDDWRLPTKDELKQLYNYGRSYINTYSNYWSSTEYLFGYAYYVNFRKGKASYNNKTSLYYVRAVRNSP